VIKFVFVHDRKYYILLALHFSLLFEFLEVLINGLLDTPPLQSIIQTATFRLATKIVYCRRPARAHWIELQYVYFDMCGRIHKNIVHVSKINSGFLCVM